MSNTPKFYQPLFGNDNFYAPDVIDMAAFTAPVTNSIAKPEPKTTPVQAAKQK
ncbi:MAG TPA: hypothetical protein VIN59_08740 [Alphaproteobacteria bacterium]